MSPLAKSLLSAIALMALGACATATPVAAPVAGGRAPASIAVSVGPCFGFCPVYDAKVAANGTVSFTGPRHTAVLGTRESRTSPQRLGIEEWMKQTTRPSVSRG